AKPETPETENTASRSVQNEVRRQRHPDSCREATEQQGKAPPSDTYDKHRDAGIEHVVNDFVRKRPGCGVLPGESSGSREEKNGMLRPPASGESQTHSTRKRRIQPQAHN